MLTKEKLIETIRAMSDEKVKDIDAVIEEIVLLEKVEKGLDALNNGNVFSEQEVDKEIEKW